MTQAPHLDGTRSCFLASHMLLIACVFLIGGCQSANKAPDQIVQATEHIQAPIRQLQARAELETLTPGPAIDHAVVQQFVPDGFTPLPAGSPAHQRAMLPLDQVLASISPIALPEPPKQPRLAQIQQATKLYARARSMRQSGDNEGALDNLSNATVLDPTSPTLFNTLGDLYLDLGDRMSAIGAYQQAADLGGATARALSMLAADAAATRNNEPALQLATLARNTQTDDPMAHTVANLIIGGVLIEDGRLLAGATALTESLESFDPTLRDPRWRSEIIQFHAQHSTLWMRIGDAWTALGVPTRAAIAYANAVDPQRRTPYPLVARQIAAHLRAGQPALAALTFLDHLNASPARTAFEERQWARTLASIDSLGSIIPNAIGELRTQTKHTPSDARALIRNELAARTDAGRIETLKTASPELISPIIVAQSIEGFSTDDERFNACVSILRDNPQAARPVAAAFVRSLQEPLAFVQAHTSDTDKASRLLIVNTALELGRADLLRDAPAYEPSNAAAIATEAQLAAFNAQWDRANQLIDTLDAIDSPFATRALAHTLLVAQQPARAWAIIAEHADYSDASVTDLLAAASIARSLNKHEDARSFLERALEIDPTFEEAYEQLILLHAPGGPLANDEEHQQIVRQLSATLPRSSLLTLVRANELARNGRLGDAELILTDLAERNPHRDIGINLLLGIWTALDNAGDETALDRAEQWLVAHLDRIVVSNPTRLALARVYLARGNPEQSLQLLDDGYTRTGSTALARTAEMVLESQLGRRDEAIDRVLARTAHSQDIDTLLERAQRLAELQRFDEAESILNNQIPATTDFRAAQQLQIQRTLFALAQTTNGLNPTEAWITLFDTLRPRLGSLSTQLLRIRLTMIAQLHPTQHDLVVAATIDALDALDTNTPDEQRTAIETVAVQQLLADARQADAFAVLYKLATRDGQLNNQLGIEILRVAAGIGDAADTIGIIDRLARDGYLDDIIALADDQFGLPSRDRPGTSEDELRSDVAYTIASIAQAFKRPDAADALFELALSYDNNHPWANNDYAYALVERNERLIEAEQMLIRAVAALPTSSSILDSLGWARYKLGVLDDERNDAGEVIREGAASLLQRAIDAETDSSANATIYDHLGDTLWRLRRFDEAFDAWLDAERSLRSQIQEASTLENINEQALERLSTQLRDLRLKIADVESEKAPQIAPIPSWSTPVPIRQHQIEVDPGK